MAQGDLLAHDGRRKKGRHQWLQPHDQRRNACRHAMRHRPIDRSQIAAMQQGSGNGRMKGVGPVGPGRPLIQAMATNKAPAMGKRMLRKVSGSTWPAESLATTNPVAHSTTKSAGAKAIQLGAGFMAFPMPSFAARMRVLS